MCASMTSSIAWGPSKCDAAAGEKPPIIGVMGGAFNPIHLGHVLLAVTVLETKPVDEVVVVPVFKHPVKKDLLPFEDRVAMCQLSLQRKDIKVSTVEQETGESNIAMLRALKAKYPKGAQLLWICGDDVFEWIDNAKGQAMMRELDGLIVQRRLHRSNMNGDEDNYYKSPVDTERIESLSRQHGLKIDLIFGELPHFSSTLVRSSPAAWRAYLPLCVATYLDERPHLLDQLIKSSGCEQAAPQPLKADAVDDGPSLLQRSSSKRSSSTRPLDSQELHELRTSCVMNCIAVVHALQRERGRTAQALSLRNATAVEVMQKARREANAVIKDVPQLKVDMSELSSMIQEMQYAPQWLQRDRDVIDQYLDAEEVHNSAKAAWLHRVNLVKKYGLRIDILIQTCEQVLHAEVVDAASCRDVSLKKADHQALNPREWWTKELYDHEDTETAEEVMLRLFRLWSAGKEALGRERAFVSAGGSQAHTMVRNSLHLRSCLSEVVDNKERMLQRIFSMEMQRMFTAEIVGPSISSASQTLHALLARITVWEWKLMQSLPASTPLRVVHQTFLSEELSGTPCILHTDAGSTFDQDGWFEITSGAVDFMLAHEQGLAAAICAATRRQLTSAAVECGA